MTPYAIPSSHAIAWVLLSLVISAIGAFVALTAASRIAAPGKKLDRVNVLAAGAALGGIGIWAMHFVGMLALHVDMGVGYSLPETVASLAIAVAGSAGGLFWVARQPRSLAHLVGAGSVLAVAVCVMHYLGMAGMRFGGEFQWDALRVISSVVIAWVASIAALLLAFRVRGLQARAGASVVMALAVGAMHYTGMSAATFICTTANPAAFPVAPGVVASLDLPVLVTVMSLGMAFVIAIDQAFQRFAAPIPVPARR